MDKIRTMLKKKPPFFLIGSVVYLVFVALIKWGIHPSFNTLWFVVGGIVGIYFLDAAEDFFALTPSPFRSIVFMAAYVVVSFFVATSSSIALAQGLVLSLFLQLLFWQAGEFTVTGSDSSWYRMIAVVVAKETQKWILIGFAIIFFIETYLFIR